MYSHPHFTNCRSMTNVTVLGEIRFDFVETSSIMRGITDQLLAITSGHHQRHEAGFLRHSVGLGTVLCEKKLLVFVSTMPVKARCFMAISIEECKVPKQRRSPHYSPASYRTLESPSSSMQHKLPSP